MTHSRRPITGHRSHVAVAAAAAAAAVLLAACTSGSSGARPAPGSTTTAAKAPAGVVSRSQAARILTAYIKINNEANRKRSSATNATIETGVLRRQSLAEFATYAVLDKDQRKILSSFSYVQPSFYIPRAAPAGTAPWFAVLAHGDWSATQWSYMVFVQVGPGQWRMAAQTEFTDGTADPGIATDADGLATVVDPDASRLAIRPSALPLAVTDNYVTGGRGDGQVFATTPAATAQRTAHQDAATRFEAKVGRVKYLRGEDPDGAVFALRTRDGGALAIASEVHTEDALVTLYGTTINLGAHALQRTWVHKSDLHYLATTYTCLDAAAIPKTGRVRLLGFDCQNTNATGY